MSSLKLADELTALAEKFNQRLYSAMRSQQQDVIVNGPTHPGLLEPMKEILEARYAEYKILHETILAALTARSDAASETFVEKRALCLAYAEQHWNWGNITKLGIVNQLVRDGFKQDWAIEQAERIAPAAARSDGLEGSVHPTDRPPSIDVRGFEYREQERACINGCLYLRADFASKRFTARSDGWREGVEAAAKACELDTRSDLAKDLGHEPEWFRHSKNRATAIRNLTPPAQGR